MVEQRNIIILGASISGLQAAHYVMKHIFPALRAKKDAKYHVYVLNPSPYFYFRVGSPRVATSTKRLAAEKIFLSLHDGFKPYSKDDFTFIEASATGLNTNQRKVLYRKPGSTTDEELQYHALLVATGSRTYEQAFSMSTSSEATKEAIETMNTKVLAAKDIVIVGGGPTAVETAGEMGEMLNGRPGWFSKPTKKVNITIITAAEQLLPSLRPSIGALAEQKLNQLGVDVLYRTRVADVTTDESGRSIITLAKGNKLEADLYVPAYGVQPNSSWLPESLLNPAGYLETNAKTLRVDTAGPRVYALGDIASYSRNGVADILAGLPVVMINMKRDLFSYDPAFPDRPAKGQDRFFKVDERASLIAPVGSAGGVGEVMGWKVPNWAVWLIKSRDFLVGMSAVPTATGASVKKEYKWTGEEIVHI